MTYRIEAPEAMTARQLVIVTTWRRITTDSGITVAYVADPDTATMMAAAPDLLSLLLESQSSIGGDWRQRRDTALANATGAIWAAKGDA